MDIRSVSVLANKIFRRKDLKYDPKRCLVGRGGFADVYKAVLHGNMTVAFKKPNIGGSRFTDRYMLMRYKHYKLPLLLLLVNTIF